MDETTGSGGSGGGIGQNDARGDGPGSSSGSAGGHGLGDGLSGGAGSVGSGPSGGGAGGLGGAGQEVMIVFDDTAAIRVLDPTKFKQAEDLDKDCGAFTTKITDFNTRIHNLVSVLDQQSRKIEHEKLRAIGLRNKVDAEVDNRSRQQKILRTQINERRAELDRLARLYESLSRVGDKQQETIDHMSES